MRFFTSFLILLSSFVSINANLLTTKQGILNGSTLECKRNHGRRYSAYWGIPFAQPPVGKLRFQLPTKPKPWIGVREAKSPPPDCVQGDKDNPGSVVGNEDCLYLNVFTPLNAGKGDKYPIIVYVHGGVYKSAFHDSGNYIMGSDVIMVFANYREGALGFLSTGDTVIPGNLGLKDQIMALKWVQENIEDFGGDPNHVTLHGHSSGAVCVHLHTFSPLSNGLFHQVIMQSGAGYCTLSYWGRDVAISVTKEFATRVNCTTESSKKLLKCLMKLDASVFPLTQEEMYVWDLDPDATFRPVVESKKVKDAFMTDEPQNLPYQNSSLPWIIGLTTGEGAFKVARYLTGDMWGAKQINANFKTLFPITMQYQWNTQAKHMDFISQMLRSHYFGNLEMGPNSTTPFTNLYTDALFGICAIEAIRQYTGPKYVYWYDYKSNYSNQNQNGYYPIFLGISHADEIPMFLFRPNLDPILTPKDIRMSNELIKRWVNFVKSGNPNVPGQINEDIMGPWYATKTQEIEFLRIKYNGSMETGLYNGTYRFWKTLPLGSKYYRNCNSIHLPCINNS